MQTMRLMMSLRKMIRFVVTNGTATIRYVFGDSITVNSHRPSSIFLIIIVIIKNPVVTRFLIHRPNSIHSLRLILKSVWFSQHQINHHQAPISAPFPIFKHFHSKPKFLSHKMRENVEKLPDNAQR